MTLVFFRSHTTHYTYYCTYLYHTHDTDSRDVCQQHKCDYESVRLAASADARIGSGHTKVPGPCGHRGFGEHSIVDAARKRNLELDKPEKDWEQDKGRAVVSNTYNY